MATRDELVAAIAERYASSGRMEKGLILDEFVAVTKMHRKHAQRLLRRGKPSGRSGPRRGRRIYDDAVREALVVVWEASDRICGKRLKCLVPELLDAMERHGHLRLAAEVRALRRSIGRCVRCGSKRAVGSAAGPSVRRFAGACRSEHSPTGRIRRQGFSKPTWWPTAVRGQAAAISRRWCSRTLPRGGRSACLCSCASKLC